MNSSSLYPDLWKQARALVILKIIFDLGRPAQLRYLVAATGGDHEAISKYCNILATMGLLTRVSSHSGWTLTAQGFAFLSPDGRGTIDRAPHKKAEIPLNCADSTPLINTTTTIDSQIVVESINSQKTAFYGGNLAIFEEIGITLNPQTEFIANHIDPQVTRSEWRKLKDKGKPWPGLLIKILTTHKPKSKEQQERETRRRYAQWDTHSKP